ncbi:MAG: hypothetical protein H6667_09830 [Ardenticatenaceae bacterium]|nr:hypothetical protein [Ardenticatenaceae bacterium]MCB9443406.1 hypothetical protein [Ardenticatenaceae bacterium]
MKFWSKWLRKIHRWLAVPTFILIPTAVILKLTGNGAVMTAVPQWEMVQSLLMLFLAITGSYLYLLPYLTKWQRQQKRKNSISPKQEPISTGDVK